MRVIYKWVAILLIWLPVTVSAESYSYTDENGVQRLTDNLAEVPVDQRTGNITKTDIIAPKGPQTDDLLKTKAELDQEYAELVKDGETLNSMADMPFTEEDFDAFTEKINQFNERKANYEKQVNEFQEQVDAFHQQQAVETDTFANTESQKAATAESLAKTKAELDKAYSDLMKERETIVSEGSGLEIFRTMETFEAYQQKVAEFNERRTDYERRAKTYQEKSEAYNQSLK